MAVLQRPAATVPALSRSSSRPRQLPERSEPGPAARHLRRPRNLPALAWSPQPVEHRSGRFSWRYPAAARPEPGRFGLAQAAGLRPWVRPSPAALFGPLFAALFSVLVWPPEEAR